MCKNGFLGGDLFEGGLFGGGRLFEDLQYVNKTMKYEAQGIRHGPYETRVISHISNKGGSLDATTQRMWLAWSRPGFQRCKYATIA